MSLFQTPPPPNPAPQATGFTPPFPHVPIGTQGNQPPRTFVQTAVTLALIVGMWPADSRAYLERPNAQQTNIAPLTLTYGQQPIPEGPLSIPEIAEIVSAWPADLEPRVQTPLNRPTQIAPLTLMVPGPPPPQSRLSMAILTATVTAWTVDWPAQTMPDVAAWNVPPLQTSNPYVPLPKLIWTAWEPLPVTVPGRVPFTAGGVLAPMPRSPLMLAALLPIYQSWVQDWASQTAPHNPFYGPQVFNPAWGAPSVVLDLATVY